MTMFYRRRPPSWQETAASVLAAAGVAAVSFYVARVLLARDAVPAEPPVRAGDLDTPELSDGTRGRLRPSAPPGAGSE